MDSQIQKRGVALQSRSADQRVLSLLHQNGKQIEPDNRGRALLAGIQKLGMHVGESLCAPGKIAETRLNLSLRPADPEKAERISGEGVPQATSQQNPAGISVLARAREYEHHALVSGRDSLLIAIRIEQQETLAQGLDGLPRRT